MSRGNVDTFILIVHFLNDKWEPCHMTIGFFEIANTSGNAMGLQVNDVLAKNRLNVHVLAYVKNERNNLSIMTFVLTSIVSCEVLRLLALFVGSSWGHAMSKCCQYSTDDSKVCACLSSISIKEAQSILQKTITWTIKNVKGWQQWHKTCLDVGVPL
jgi:hypothetical protein